MFNLRVQALKKTFKKLDHDVNIHDFLGSRFVIILMKVLKVGGLTLVEDLMPFCFSSCSTHSVAVSCSSSLLMTVLL